MKKMAMFVFSLFLFSATVVLAEGPPSITLRANGKGGNLIITAVDEPVKIKFGLEPNSLAGRRVKILIRKMGEYPNEDLYYIPKSSSKWTGGIWAEDQRATIIQSLENIPAVIIRDKALPGGSTIFEVSVIDLYTGDKYVKRITVYSYDDNSCIRLFSSEKLSDERWLYHLGLAKSAIGDKSNPGVAGEFNGWQETTLVDANNDGYYELGIISFNAPGKFYWFGNKSANSWPKNWIGGYMDIGDGCNRIEFYNGSIFRPGNAPYAEQAGVGDDYFRISIDKNTGAWTVYVNLSKASDISAPFWMGPSNYWQAESLNKHNGLGWASFTIPATDKFEWVAGGKFPSSWIGGGMYYNAGLEHQCAQRSGDSVVPCD